MHHRWVPGSGLAGEEAQLLFAAEDKGGWKAPWHLVDSS